MFKKTFANPPLRVLSTPGIVQTQSEKNLRKLMAKDKKRKRDLLNKERKGGKESIEDNEILLDVEGQGEKSNFVWEVKSFQFY